MQTKTEFLIWDKIVNSAKQRFNYEEYLQYFSDSKIYDKIILHIIVGFMNNHQTAARTDAIISYIIKSHFPKGTLFAHETLNHLFRILSTLL